MIRVLSLVILFGTQLASAETLNLKNYVCTSEIKTILADWKIDEKSDWKKEAADPKTFSYKAHGAEVAEWISISAPNQTSAELRHYQADGKVFSVTLNTQKCSEQKWTGKDPAPVSKKLDLFTDQDLKKTLDETKNGIIYVWSPNMSLSKPGIKNITAAGKDLGMPVKLLMDPFADQRFAKGFIKEQNMPADSMKRMKSRELASYGATLHYPAMIIYKNGKVCSEVQNGYRTQEKYRMIANEIFGRCP